MRSPEHARLNTTSSRSGLKPVFSVELEAGSSASVIRCAGRWTVQSVDDINAAVSDVLDRTPPGDVRLDLSAMEILDTAGALSLRRLRDGLSEKGPGAGRRVEITEVPPKPASVLKTVAEALDPVDAATAPQAPDRTAPGKDAKPAGRDAGRGAGRGMIGYAEQVGVAVFDILGESRGLVGFLGLIVTRFGRVIMRPKRLRLTSIFFHAEQTGLKAVPIVCLLSFLVGIVIAYQGAVQLRQFGADLFVVNLIGISVLRELGILVTAIILAGRSGSAFTAQIGTMKVNQEVDAMSAIGLDPVETLVLPRLIALLVTMPLLTFIANIAGVGGGALMAWVILEIDLGTFIRQFQSDVDVGHLWVGMVKAPVFAFTIAMVGCYQGLRVTGSAESVGVLTTKSVVQSIFLVIVLDAVFSIVLSDWGF